MLRRTRTSCSLGTIGTAMIAIVGQQSAVAQQIASFSEQAIQRGVVYYTASPNSCVYSYGFGIAFVDLDNDGDPDLVTLGDLVIRRVGIFENDGTGFFVDHSTTSGIPELQRFSGVSAADYDSDGDLDLFLTRYRATNLLYRNEGAFTFTDVSATAGIGDNGPSMGCAWGDYDGDGRLDLYVSNYSLLSIPGECYEQGVPYASLLYRNLGDGTFEDQAPALGVDFVEPAFQPIFFDYDNDSDADLYLSTDKGYSLEFNNHLFENVAGVLVDVTDASGTAANLESMGVAVGDFDGNGFQDLYCTNTPLGNPLFLNQGDGTFVESSALAGVGSFATGWGALFFDFDNNGLLDLYVCNEWLPGQQFALNRLYVDGGFWRCPDIALGVGLTAPGQSFGLAAADIDDDGDLDLAVQNYDSNTLLFVNNEGETRNWVKFDVVGQGDNLFAIGANVKIRLGSIWYGREIFAGSSYKSQNDLKVHFGLNDATQIDEVQAVWPGGSTRSLANVAIKQTFPLYPPDRLGDSDGDGDIDSIDTSVFVDVLMGTDTDIDHVAVNDMNGDGFNNGADIAPFTLQALSSP